MVHDTHASTTEYNYKEHDSRRLKEQFMNVIDDEIMQEIIK